MTGELELVSKRIKAVKKPSALIGGGVEDAGLAISSQKPVEKNRFSISKEPISSFKDVELGAPKNHIQELLA